MSRRKDEVKAMTDAVAGMMRSFGVEEAVFADDAGRVHGRIKAKPKKRTLKPLSGFGDTVRRGDQVIVTLREYGRPPVVEFDAKPVTVKDYSNTLDDPWMVVEKEAPEPNEGPTSFNYGDRAFKVVGKTKKTRKEA